MYKENDNLNYDEINRLKNMSKDEFEKLEKTILEKEKEIKNFRKIVPSKVKYLGKTDRFGLIKGKVYDVISVEKDWYRIVDETGEDYLYPPEKFEIVNNENQK